MKRERDEAQGAQQKSRKEDDDLAAFGLSASKMAGANVMLSGHGHQLAVGKPKRQFV